MRRTTASILHWPLIALAAVAAGSLLSASPDLPHPAWTLLALLPAVWRPLRLSALIACGLCLWMGWQHASLLEARLPAQWHGSEQELSGRIVGVPTIESGVRRFLFSSPAWPGGRLRLAWYRDAPPLAAGECWQLTVRLRQPRGSANPGGLDYEGWLFRQRIIATGSVRAGEQCGPAQGLDAWRQRVAASIEQALGPGRSSATVQALALGLRDAMTDEQWDILRRTGTSHLFAISGLHLGLLAALGFGLGQWLWRRVGLRLGGHARQWGAVTAAVMSLAYAAFAGFGIPVQRALVMSLLGILAVSTGRWRAPWQIFSIAVVVVLLIDPLAISAPGFWLSFTAVAGILGWLSWHPARPLWRRLLEIQLLLGVLLMPLTLGFFGGASVLALPVNLVLVPAFAVLLPLVLLVALLHAMPGAGLLLPAFSAGLNGLWDALAWVADASLAYVQPSVPPAGLLALALLGLFLGLLPRAVGARFAGLLCVLPALTYSPPRPLAGQLWLTVWDVGQGQSVWLQTATHDLLYDAGPAYPGGFDAGRMIVVPGLLAQGVSRLDRLIISHSDNDHAGGAGAVRHALQIEDEISDAGRRCRAGMQWRWDGVDFEILHPAGGDWSDNSGSCVLRVVTASGHAVLLPGDIERDAEQALLARSAGLQADVLLVPHHGSDSSSSAAFIRAVAPRLALVSAGYANRWGFPRPAVRRRYAEQGVPLCLSGEQGAITLRIGTTLRFSSHRDRSGPIWRYPSPDPEAGNRLSCAP